MTVRVMLIGTLCVLGLEAAKLPDWYTRELPDAEIQARLVRDLDEIERVTGDSFEGEVILVELRVRPLYGSAVTLDRGEFLLRARNNNDTSRARTPDRIGGGAVLALVTERVGAPAGVISEQASGPIWARPALPTGRESWADHRTSSEHATRTSRSRAWKSATRTTSLSWRA